MPFGTSIAKAEGKTHDVERKLYLGRDAVLTLVKGNRGETKLGELTTGWHLDLRERVEPVTGARYFRLFVTDPTGERMQALKEMTAVRYRGVFYKPMAKPSFAGAVPSYVFKVQEVGPQIAS